MIKNLKKYSSRERVLLSLNHKEPDRVPVDLGGTIVTGIMAHALDRLRKYLKMKSRPVKVYEIFQMLGEVELDIIERFNIDILPVEPRAQFFGIKRENYKKWNLWDKTQVLMPGQFNIERDSFGNLLLHSKGDPKNPIEGIMPKGGFYFDIPSLSNYDPFYSPPYLEELKWEHRLSIEDLEFLAAKADRLRKSTDKALILDLWGAIGLKWVGSIPNFLVLLYTDKKYVKELFKIRTETALINLENLKKFLDGNIDIICLEGTDFGAQDREMFSPEIFQELFLPYFKIQNNWIHKNTEWKIFQHSCGSIINLIPLFVEAEVDILNPVQTSAKGMDPKWLKEQFGDAITFWGGGVDTQKTLPFKDVQETIQEVKERIRVFAPGGGFIFNTIHNIQQCTAPENIIAAYDTVIKFGKYPIRI